MPSRVRIVEMGPRDGLQNEAAHVSVADRIALIERLVAAGSRHIEAGSFVSQRWVPQMAHTDEVLAGIKRREGVTYSVLVPNMQGLQAALACGVDEIAVFGAASESFSRRNINCSIDESLARFAPVVAAGRAAGIRVRGYVSCVLGCPYEGGVAPAAVADVARRLFEMGCAEISLGDTIGTGTPGKAQSLTRLVAGRVPVAHLAVHFHDTYGQALANILACLECGVSVVDAAVAGLGGCPYARGASGNVATEDVVYMLDGMGIETGLDLALLAQAGAGIASLIGKDSQSRAGRALAAKAAAG